MKNTNIIRIDINALQECKHDALKYADYVGKRDIFARIRKDTIKNLTARLQQNIDNIEASYLDGKITREEHSASIAELNTLYNNNVERVNDLYTIAISYVNKPDYYLTGLASCITAKSATMNTMVDDTIKVFGCKTNTARDIVNRALGIEKTNAKNRASGSYQKIASKARVLERLLIIVTDSYENATKSRPFDYTKYENVTTFIGAVEAFNFNCDVDGWEF